jgi:multiple sugar transport system substrate-binding protein
LYGIPYVVEAMLTGASRYDLIQQAGLAFPKTTDDLVKVLQAVNKKERVAGYVTDNHYGWTFIPYLQAFGGNVFRAPPDDLFPTLDTPEAVQAADYFARLIREFGPNGGITYTADQSLQALKQGRVNLSDASQTYLAQLGNAESSRTLNTAHFGPMVNGPKGWFPAWRPMRWVSRQVRKIKRRRGRLSSGRFRNRTRHARWPPDTVHRPGAAISTRRCSVLSR